MSDQIKLVINHNDGKATVGVQAPDCDPFFKTIDGDFLTVLQNAGVFVEEARQQWAQNPRYPKAVLPTPPPPPPVIEGQKVSKPAKTGPQQSLF